MPPEEVEDHFRHLRLDPLFPILHPDVVVLVAVIVVRERRLQAEPEIERLVFVKHAGLLAARRCDPAAWLSIMVSEHRRTSCPSSNIFARNATTGSKRSCRARPSRLARRARPRSCRSSFLHSGSEPMPIGPARVAPAPAG